MMPNNFSFTKSGKPYNVSSERLFAPSGGGSGGKIINNTTLIIPGAICKRWVETGGRICPFCAFPRFVTPITGGKTFDSSEYWEMYQQTKGKPSDRLTIFNGGSFFPKEEIPLDFQNQVYDDFALRDDVRVLAVETRPEYFTDEVAQNIRSRIGNKEFMIMIGLESFDSKIRNGKLKKGMTQKSFLDALAIANKHNIKVFVYVMLGAPGLSEEERVADTLSSLNELTSLGVNEIGLSVTFVSEGTELLTLYQEGLFAPPNLWSVVGVLQEAHKYNWPLRFGGFEETPTPVAIARSCDICSDEIYKALGQHRSIGVMGQLPVCDCQKKTKISLI